MNKKKIVNDPVYGFITIPGDFLFDLLEHRYFQRLRRIRQLGLSDYVYPGAVHTRFHHALGAMHLTCKAIEVLRQKGIEITGAEAEAVSAAILLHDIGHGPFSHTLEHSIFRGVPHEQLSQLFMEKLNKEFKGKLDLTLKIFQNKYKKKFLHQLISSQLDMDRLDYLSRDSFFTGVSEGIVASERIINMLYVAKGELVIEEKGIYSIEKFIIARRLMYWQVYLHKTVIASEVLLTAILKRAKEIAMSGGELFTTPALGFFLENDLTSDKISWSILETFSKLDDSDVWASVKAWQDHEDRILSLLSKNLIDRKLSKMMLSDKPFSKAQLKQCRESTIKALKLSEKEADFFVHTGSVENNAYKMEGIRINVIKKDGTVVDVAKASDNYNLTALEKTVKKYYISYYR
ncbi:MAG: HD domain-containing protein [Bacteroidia bacterium]|nr:HD domain-containing protein [Bacteroidia bacterium]